MVVYTLIKEKIMTDCGASLNCYGIAAYSLCWRGVRCCLKVRDISADRQQMLQLAWDCTRGQLAVTQLMDVLEDRLG